MSILFGLFQSYRFLFKSYQPDRLHNAINWNCSVVSGSYALHSFTGDKSWQPHDIDIMVACSDTMNFQKEAEQFSRKAGATLIKESWFNDKHIEPDQELFHEYVLGSKTYQVPGTELPVQLICLKQHPVKGLNTPIDILNVTSDVPSCVSYSISNGVRIFHIPEKGREAILTKTVKESEICPSRKAKYQTRGYTFVN